MQFIADRLKVLRNRKSWSCADLAKRTGLSERTIQRLEAKSPRQSTTREKTVKKLAATLGVDSGVLTGAAPLPDDEQPSGPRKPDFGRQRFSADISPAARNAYELIRLQYGVKATAIVEMAPLFFVLLAEASLAGRRKKLEELNEQIERLGKMANGHLVFASPHRAEEGSSYEEKSIEARDLFGAKITGDVYDLGYVAERDNPFTGFLREMANALDDPHQATVRDWENMYADDLPDYAVCAEWANMLAGQDKELLEALMDGEVPLTEMPSNLRHFSDDSVTEQRIAWMREKLSEARARLAELIKLLPPSPLSDFLQQPDENDGEGS